MNSNADSPVPPPALPFSIDDTYGALLLGTFFSLV